jgi:hypothetical protein
VSSCSATPRRDARAANRERVEEPAKGPDSHSITWRRGPARHSGPEPGRDIARSSSSRSSAARPFSACSCASSTSTCAALGYLLHLTVELATP